jgi:hypothetical protein
MAVSWRFDGDDLLSGVGERWDEFALANDGDACIPPPIGDSLADFVSSPDLCVVWSAIFRLARRDHHRPVTLTYRCDGPAERRFMTATVTAATGSEVEIVSALARPQARPPVRLLDASEGNRSDDMIRMCGWCARIQVDGWVDVEEGCRRLRLLEVDAGPLPRISHGICGHCRDAVAAGLDLSPGLLPANRRHVTSGS